MRRLSITLVALALLQSGVMFAQKNAEKGEEYRRSSLCTYLIDEGEMPKIDTIKQAFLDAPIPIKYNDHNVCERIFSVNLEGLTDEHRKAFEAHMAQSGETNKPKKKKGGFGAALGGLGKDLLNEAAGGKSVLVDDKSKQDIEIATYNYLLEQKIAKALFDKWFIDGNGQFTDALMRERGLFDASALDLQTAQSSLGGMEILATEGEELVKNTFVVVSRFRYMSKDEVIAEGQSYVATAGALTGNSEAAGALNALGGLGAKAALGEGYYVTITSYLYQLIWNDEVKAKLYELWDNKAQYDTADFFELKYIGSERARAGVRAGMFTKKTEEELIRIATINATDAVLAKLEKKYETFRTKTPIVITENGEITAHIGTKEDLKGGDKFEVLERIIDKKTGLETHQRVGTIKVAKGKIWNNIYMASDDENATTDSNGLTATVFEGNAKSFRNGMLIRQLD
ncbi:hypothetical protein [Bacteroides sp. 51]|uniref:hypothetical protein n=1 Tax=Bacteroides sp. 51 TaxID=2302938 RepID=UPI0013D54B2C|nr:hypothetical protein [Bacteroides sp. 51]